MTVIPARVIPRFLGTVATSPPPSGDPGRRYGVVTTTVDPNGPVQPGELSKKRSHCVSGGLAAAILAGLIGFCGFTIHTGRLAVERLNAPQTELAYQNELPTARFVGKSDAGLFFSKSDKIRDLAYNREIGHLEEKGGKIFVTTRTPLIGTENPQAGFVGQDGKIYARLDYDAFAAAYKTLPGVTPIIVDGQKYIQIGTATKNGRQITIVDLNNRPVVGVETFEELALPRTAAAAMVVANWSGK